MVQKEGTRIMKENVSLKQNISLLENEVADLKRDIEQAQVENRHLTQEARMFPEKFAELARQNQKLIVETADIHYNMGVFYVQSDEYYRAIKEFEKALDLNPDNANANYNLGFIYAEHLVDREKAIQYFRNYLTFAPDAKDAEWIRKYILTWQTWYGKEAIK
jgi:tetratricopeptide (TPR) repeat protein